MSGPGGPDIDTLARTAAKKMEEESTNVDEMKILTMYKMVEEVTISVQGQEVTKKILYLTNKQAYLFDEEAMARLAILAFCLFALCHLLAL